MPETRIFIPPIYLVYDDDMQANLSGQDINGYIVGLLIGFGRTRSVNQTYRLMPLAQVQMPIRLAAVLLRGLAKDRDMRYKASAT